MGNVVLSRLQKRKHLFGLQSTRSTGCRGLRRHRKIRSLQTREERGDENTPRRGDIPGGESGLGRTGVGGRGKVPVINNPEMQERWKAVPCG